MALDHARRSDAREARPGALHAWLLAVRPRTLTIAVGPVLVGTAAGSAEAGRFDPAAMVVAMIAAVLIQVGTNLQNDVGDFLRGADGADRPGELRLDDRPPATGQMAEWAARGNRVAGPRFRRAARRVVRPPARPLIDPASQSALR